MAADGNGAGAVAEQRSWRGYAQIALIVLALAVAWYFARAPRVGPVPGDAAVESAAAVLPTAAVVRPAATDQALTIHLTGTVSVREATAVRSEVPGRVVWVSPDFEGGGFVAAGEPLVRMDPAAFELAVASAQAAVEGAEAQVWLEEALGEENEREFLLADPEGTPSAWVRREPHAALAQAQLKRAQAELALAELQLARTEISLPYDVRVVTAGASVGQWVHPEDIGAATSLGGVYRPETLQVGVPMEPKDLAYLAPAVGRAVRVTGRMGAWTAEVTRISPVVSAASRLATVFIEFAETEDLELLPPPGTFVEVAIEGPALSDAFVLPHTVLQEGAGVWVVRDGRLELFEPEAHGWIPEGWVVSAFDAGEGVVTGALPGARAGLEVSAQVDEAAR